MSDLQIGLISLGIVLILVVVCFNWWQDRRVRQRMQEHFPETEQDPLMGGVAPVGVRREPGFGAVETAPDASGDDPDDVDPATEAVIDIAFAHPASGRELYEATQAIHKVGGKPVRVFAECEGGGHRAWVREDESYVSMQLAVLLANRSGALTDIEWSHLWTIAQRLAEHFDGSVEGPEQDAVLAKAGQLDALCAELDAQVGLAVRLDGVRPVAEVAQVVRDAGFLNHGRHLAWMADNGIPRFTVLFDGVPASEVQSAGVETLDLLLDLPRSAPDEQAFSRMACVGRDLAARLEAILVDDQGRPVADDADHAIDESLSVLYGNLDKAGFMAGTERTTRLFS